MPRVAARNAARKAMRAMIAKAAAKRRAAAKAVKKAVKTPARKAGRKTAAAPAPKAPRITFKPKTDGEYRIQWYVRRRDYYTGSRFVEYESGYATNLYMALDLAEKLAKSRKHVLHEHPNFAAFMDGKTNRIDWGRDRTEAESLKHIAIQRYRP